MNQTIPFATFATFAMVSLALALPAQTPAPGRGDEKPPVERPVGQPVSQPEQPKEKPAPKPAEPEGKKPADAPVPAGADPADLAALRSAEQMIEAEKKLAARIKAGRITGFDKLVTFDELSSWIYEDGLAGMPKRVQALDGKKVLMTGFMLPIDEIEGMKEFLLVQSLWSCCYGQPPDIHGFVRVVMPKGETTDHSFSPFQVVGTFKVEATVIDGYCVDIYQLHVESLEVLD